MPSSRQARMTRTAISPRLAIRIFLNMNSRSSAPPGARVQPVRSRSNASQVLSEAE